MQSPLITYAQAAEDLGGVGVSTVRRLVKFGHLTAYRITERCHRIDADSVAAYLRSSKIEPKTAARGKCRSGKTATPGAGASNETARSVAEALELARKRLKQKRAHEQSSPRA